MGVFSRMAALVVLIPKPILGGAGIVMFGMVAVSGIRTLGQVNYRNNNNGMVVALTLGLGMMPVLVPNLFTQFPPMVQLFLHSGITIGTLTAIVANLTLNGSVPLRVNHETPVPDPAPPVRRHATWPSEPSECGSRCAKFKGETAGRSPGGVTMLTRLLFALLTLLLLAIPVVQQGSRSP